MDTIFDWMSATNDLLWGPWTFLFLLGSGILFTLWTRFTQITSLTHAIPVLKGKYDSPDAPGAISHFQALSAALSGTVGLGNIGGVALAIGVGGPGALLWMWVTAALGMALKTIEITLAMMYRNTSDPENPHGGAMWVVDQTLGKRGESGRVFARLIGGFFCLTLLVSALTGGIMFQAWNVAALSHSSFRIPRIFSGLVLATLLGLVVLGGIKRIGRVAAKLVPLMCVLYLLAAFAILFRHLSELPSALSLVVHDALNGTQAQGAFLGGTAGWAFSVGMRRALYSNEAGQGSAPIAHAAAKTREPAREGILGGLGPFLDTICVCTVTALVIIVTDTWNREPYGEIQGEVRVMRDPQIQGPTWIVRGPKSPSSLPQREGKSWSVGDRFFLVAEVEDTTRRESGSNLVKIEGRLTNSPSGEFANILRWSPVELDETEWEEIPRSVRLKDSMVYRDLLAAPQTAEAFDREFPGLGTWLLPIVSWLFALSTMITWTYYGEQAVAYLTGSRGLFAYKVATLLLTVLAAAYVTTSDQLETLVDIGTGWMLWSNMPIVLILGYRAVRELNDYRRRMGIV
ncbi:alanine/glycine:cation symporter family protein [Kolteria novifilia]|uniref:alanine/glycine:cation symporter family protein n=1 Tax=Kolteria novifilia TaxID=2527975 RepID=UPI003AF33A29